MPRRSQDEDQYEEEEDNEVEEEKEETEEMDDDNAEENGEDEEGDSGRADAEPEGLMEKSGLTETDRRNLRKKQRDLLKDMEDREKLDVKKARRKNNELYKKVCYTREAVLDGDNLTMIVNKASQQVDRLIQVPRYDADRLSSKLVQKCRNSSNGAGGAYFDWHALGVEAGICFNSIPSHVSFLNGPLTDDRQLQVRQRKAREPRQKEDEEAEEQKPEDVKGNTARDADKLSAIEQSMKHLAKALNRRVNDTYRKHKLEIQEKLGTDEIPPPLKKKLKKAGCEVDAVQFLFNPQSFTQTVENIFHFSFLIKSGNAHIGVRDRKSLAEVDDNNHHMFGLPGPTVKYTKEENKDKPHARQAIATLTMKDWRDLCAAYEVTKGDIPHRSGSKFIARPASLSQPEE